jgi:two-component system LytT family response regulator
MTIRTIIVDDEPLVRSSIVKALRRDKDIEVVSECGDGIAAIDAIQSIQPDLLFLDVHMPGFSGLEVLARLDDLRPPITISSQLTKTMPLKPLTEMQWITF